MPKIHLSQDIWDVIYPVGSLYFTVVDDTAQKVHDRFGGNWELFGAGRTPVCVDTNDSDFNTVEKTGGEKTHTLTTNEIPVHSHGFYVTPNTHEATWISGVQRFFYDVNTTTDSKSYAGGTNNTGGGLAHNNLQPYKTCYIWKRVAD